VTGEAHALLADRCKRSARHCGASVLRERILSFSATEEDSLG